MERTPGSDDPEASVTDAQRSVDQQAQPTSQAASATTAPEEARRPATGSAGTFDEHQKPGVTGGTWIALILGAIVLIMLLIFIVQNNVSADFAYFGLAFSLPLGVAMLFAAIAGVLVMAFFGSVRLFKLGRRVRVLEKEREKLKRTLG